MLEELPLEGLDGVGLRSELVAPAAIDERPPGAPPPLQLPPDRRQGKAASTVAVGHPAPKHGCVGQRAKLRWPSEFHTASIAKFR